MPGPPTPTAVFVITKCSTLADDVSSILVRGHGDFNEALNAIGYGFIRRVKVDDLSKTAHNSTSLIKP